LKKLLLKYLVEIAIIIIGVVIAFYLTEYGQTLSRNKTAKDVITQIHIELKDNLIDLERDFHVHKTALFSNLRVLKFLDNKEAVTDSLIMDFYWMTIDEYVFANSSGYENLMSFGINLIKDDELRHLITVVYNHDFPRLEKGNTIHPDINAYLNPFFKDHFRINQDSSLKYTIEFEDSLKITYPYDLAMGVKYFIGYHPIDETELLNNDEFRFLVSKALEFRLYKYQFYQSAIANVKRTIAKIEELTEKN